MNNIPLNIKLDNAKTKLVKALNECITEEGLPAYLLSGVVTEIMLDVQKQINIELKEAYNSVISNMQESNKQ